MKFSVDVDETIYRTTTYLIKAKSKEEARSIAEDQKWNEMKIIDTCEYDGNINEVRSVEPFKK